MGGYDKRISAKDLHEGGYVSEANRKFFHALGLALAVNPETGEIFVLDDREDLEGWNFPPSILGLPEKAKKIQDEMDKRNPHRLAALGYIIQPLEGIDEHTA